MTATPGPPVIRPAIPEGAEACAAILNDWIDATPWMPRVHAPGDVIRLYREAVLVLRRATTAWTGRRCDGFVAADGDDVTALYLAPQARGRGLGAALLASVRGAGRQRLRTFEANHGARRFYAREGFVEVRRTDGENEEGLPDILLERSA